MKNEKEDVLKKWFDKEIRPSFDNESPQEHPPNPMRGGRVHLKTLLIQPHNYRLYFNFNPTSFNPQKLRKVGLVGFNYSLKNYNSEHHLDNFYGCRIVVRKKRVEVINKWFEKQWKVITGTPEELKSRVDDIQKDMDNKCIEALKKMVSITGGSTDYKIIKRRGEWGIHNDEYLDKIPEDQIIHDTVFKKVYPNKTEFYDPVHIKNYVSNRAMEEIAPDVAEELNHTRELIKGILEINASTSKTLNEFISNFLPIQADFAWNIQTHTEVLKGINGSFKKFNKLLSKKQKRLSEFI